jgi:hypothetical protein
MRYFLGDKDKMGFNEREYFNLENVNRAEQTILEQ